MATKSKVSVIDGADILPNTYHIRAFLHPCLMIGWHLGLPPKLDFVQRIYG